MAGFTANVRFGKVSMGFASILPSTFATSDEQDENHLFEATAAHGDVIDGIFILTPWWSDCNHTTLLRTKFYFSLLLELIICDK